MTHDELVRALLVERFGTTTPEFHNTRRDAIEDATALRLVSDERGAA